MLITLRLIILNVDHSMDNYPDIDVLTTLIKMKIRKSRRCEVRRRQFCESEENYLVVEEVFGRRREMK